MKAGFNSPMKIGSFSPLDQSNSPSTAEYSNDQSFTQAAQSAEKKLDQMFEAKINFGGSESHQPKGNSSLVLQKTQSCFQPLLTTFEQDACSTFEEKYNVDHNSTLGEGASCQVKRCYIKKQTIAVENNMIKKHLTPA